jgi:hypothetical protein
VAAVAPRLRALSRRLGDRDTAAPGRRPPSRRTAPLIRRFLITGSGGSGTVAGEGRRWPARRDPARHRFPTIAILRLGPPPPLAASPIALRAVAVIRRFFWPASRASGTALEMVAGGCGGTAGWPHGIDRANAAPAAAHYRPSALAFRAATLIRPDDRDLRIRAPKEFMVQQSSVCTDRRRPPRDWRLPIPDTLLTRRVGNRQVVVKVLDNGFEYESRRYRSLSAIAREVTGTRWNGLLPGRRGGLTTYFYLDLTPRGRDENGPTYSLADWVRHRDRY